MAQRNFSISALKAKFATNNTNNGSNNSNYYPFWLVEPGEEAIMRFLPDKNLDNVWFLQEKIHHELLINGERKRVPCLKQYGEKCSICDESAKRYKEEGENTVVGKQLYRKKQWIGQVLVMDDPLPADKETGETSQGKIKLVTLTSQIYNAIKATVESGELEVAPHAYDDGTNFAIRVQMNGKYKDYARSNFLRKSSSLDEATIDWIEENLVDLSTLLPAKPDASYVDSLLDAFLNGGVLDTTSVPVTTVNSVSSAVNVTKDEPTIEQIMSAPSPKAEVVIDSEDQDAEDILASIRAQRAKRAAA